MGLIRRFSQDCDLPLTLANFLKFYPHISLEEIYKRGNWSALVKQAHNHTVSEMSDESCRPSTPGPSKPGYWVAMRSIT